MTPIATALVNWTELWRIVLAALIGGAGVVIMFGLMVVGVSRGRTAARRSARYGLFALSGLCGVLVVAVAAVGVYAMAQKPSSVTPKPKTAAAAGPASPRHQSSPRA